ncbi:uncharacterized protein GGS22DRAFT_56971 [Annulohypoxylon maeteangense]|uniref:uncharacterized protein n=1 Tax=Annulohypoxylon maeteangense TaxID=1927788 RepID=UPI002007B5A6|nr:uncharacterized protein GGS22DRAFT_56971 [Annulohypoxylon maeteangense]KAI0881818.1 hypothetical protein GGS22DRAFT_56971 [Annulohypoxylon maeteangense]
MSVLTEITHLHTTASHILRPLGRAPTRSEYASALELADEALELARTSPVSLNPSVIPTCEAFQRFCYDPLLRCYARAAGYERFVYERSSSASATKRKRAGRVFDTDPGEHLVEALQAVRLGRLLEEREGRRIRWRDEV